MYADAEHYQTIIVGAGSAGCLLANRLTANPENKVLLLEAGGRDRWIWLHVPVGYAYTIGNPLFDWCFQTEPEPQMNGRRIPIPRGKVLGGSSSINGMFQVRGQAADFDHWRQLGLPGWGWDDVLPYFKQHEDFEGGASGVHGAGGELRIESSRIKWPALDVIRRAIEEDGLRWIGDLNTGDNEGIGTIHFTQKRGFRWSAARAFLNPARKRPNLRIETEAPAQRILFDGKRAIGVEYKQGLTTKVALAKEIVVATGAIGTPQLLMLSGIGPAAHLREHGIDVVLDKPGVGGNLQDHLQFNMHWKVEGLETLNDRYTPLGRAGFLLEYLAFQSGPMAMGPTSMAFFTRSSPDRDRANITYNVLPFARDMSEGLKRAFYPFSAITMSVYDLRPESRGTIRLKSGNAADYPELRFNYLSAEADRRVAADSIRISRRVMNRPALKPYKPVEVLPGPDARDDDDASLIDAFARYGTTIFHPVGTAKMGLPSDSSAVVDDRLRVIGIEGLRVIDASVMPTVTSGNTNAPTLMIAEKGAAMILEDGRRG